MSQMAPLSFAIAFGPLAVYLLLLGLVNLSRRPTLIGGGRDLWAMALGCAGLVMVGPMELFLPPAAATQFGAYVWLLMGGLYVFSCTLWVLSQRPRLCIYNMRRDEAKPLVAEVAAGLDPQSTWAGNHVSIPALGLELQVEPFRAMRHVTLLATSMPMDFAAWRELELAMAQRLQGVRVRPNPRGFSFVVFGLLIGTLVFWNLAQDPASIEPQLRELLRLPPR